MKHSLKLALMLSVLAAFACKDDEDNDSSDSSTNPLQPEGALGRANRPTPRAADRIDRAGRPAITAALISSFDPASREADLDRYNTSGNGNPDFTPLMEASLAILDGLDRQCGNQLLAGADPNLPTYRPLAGALTDDQLYVRSDRPGAAVVYLGVEAEAVGAVDEGGGSGGGRAPGDDVVAVSYTVLAAGALDGSIDDGVPEDDAEHDIDEFPFLAEPQ